MLNLYIVRHGQTLFNVLRRMQGWCDTPLTDEGIKQAEQLGRGLQDIPFLHAYSSSSGRALQTARHVIGDRDIPLEAMDELRELYFGCMEGLDVISGQYLRGDIGKYDWQDVGGETMEQLMERMMKGLQQIVDHHTNQDGNILIVSHGVAITSTLMSLAPDRFASMQDPCGTLSNCSITLLAYDHQQFELKEYNNIDYLKKGEKIYEENNQ